MTKQPFVLDVWIDEDETIEEIKRSIGSANFSDIDPVYDAALAADEVKKRNGEQGIEFHRPSLRKWLKHHEPQIGRKRGPNFQYDWPGLAGYLNVYINKVGLPDKKQELVYEAQNWFEENKVPEDRPKSEATIKEHVYPIYDEHKKAEKDGI